MRPGHVAVPPMCIHPQTLLRKTPIVATLHLRLRKCDIIVEEFFIWAKEDATSVDGVGYGWRYSMIVATRARFGCEYIGSGLLWLIRGYYLGACIILIILDLASRVVEYAWS